jgi:uncharacterized protein YcfJ
LFAHLPQKAKEMKKSLLQITPVLFSALATGMILSLPAQAQTSYHDAQVIESKAIYRVIETSVPSRQCWEEEVVRSSSRHHYRSHTPGLLGAVIGGAIGNALGSHKSSQRVGTVVGALLGGSIARDIVKSQYNPVARLETVERCKTDYSYQQEEKLVGYDVLYRYNGADYTVRMPENPGPTMRVRVNVEPVI